jgi:hypothetical protein
MVELLLEYFERVHARGVALELLREGALYQAFQTAVIAQGERAARDWCAFVRDRFPMAPVGFFWVGKFANGPRRHRPGPSPRLWAVHDPWSPDRRRRGNLW